ncbi:MAG: response regulator [Methylococcales bacterium]|nr:response regulator [Methylococcales bacterium]
MSAIEILLIEDSLGEARLTIEAFKEHKITNRIHHVTDGVEAMEFLYKKAKYSETIRPDLILLDLNMPKMDGREVLSRIKSDEHLKSIPVVILTTSKAEQDIAESYNLNANCYIRKPVDLDQFLEVINSINNFWLSVVTLSKGH